MNDMRKLLAGAIPDPEDEPRQRDVVDAAMEWGDRRRRRDWMLAGVTALAVVAVGAGIAAGTRGSGSESAPLGGADPARSSTFPGRVLPDFPPGTAGTENCSPNANGGNDFCRLFLEEQRFDLDFAKGSAPYIQAALPAGFTVQATGTHALILSGPGGTNYLFPSVTSASTLEGRQPACSTPPTPTCFQTSVDGGKVVVGGAPSGGESAGYAKDTLQDPRITVTVGTKLAGGINGIPAPTADALLSKEQLAKIVGDAGFLAYAKTQYAHLLDIQSQLQKLAPPSASGSASGSAPGWSPSGSAPWSPSGSATWSPSGSATWSPSGTATWWPSGSMTGSSSSSGSGSSSSPGSPSGTPATGSHS